MPKSNRRAVRVVRGSTRNESCGIGGNAPAEKQRLKTSVDTVPVRKPQLKKTAPSPPVRKPRDPAKVREPKAPGMSLKAKSLAMKNLYNFGEDASAGKFGV